MKISGDPSGNPLSGNPPSGRPDATHSRHAPQRVRLREVTIRDVAEAAGVAPSTVSRTLNMPNRISASTRQRVLEAASRLEYSPSAQARALSLGRKMTVAVLVPDITNPYYFGIIKGTQMQLKAAGYTQILVDTEESAEAERMALSKLRSSADGFVITASRQSEEELIQGTRSIPVSVINRVIPGIPSVSADTPTGMRQAVEHLASLGHRRISYISGPSKSWSNENRWQAVLKASKNLGLEVVRTMDFVPTTASGAVAGDMVLTAGTTAAIAYNDLLAVGAQRRLQERGISVPEQFSMVGCDDIQLASVCTPALTTITAPIEAVGSRAVNLLLRELAGNNEVMRSEVVRNAVGSGVGGNGKSGSGAGGDGALSNGVSQMGAASNSAAAHDLPQLPARDKFSPVTLPTHLTIRESTGPVPQAG